MTTEEEARDYPSIIRRMKALKGAPHGQKKARAKALIAARLTSLKREIAASRNGKGR